MLVGDDGRVRVVDFGLARAAAGATRGREEKDPHARTPDARGPEPVGLLVGTPAYMAPEQFLGLGVEPRSDQYAFAVTVYEALFRHRPHPAGSLDELRRRVLGAPVRLPGASRELLPPPLRSAILRALHRERDRRFPSLHPFLAILDDARDEAARDLGSPAGGPSVVPGPSGPSLDAVDDYLAGVGGSLDAHPELRLHRLLVRLALAARPLPAEAKTHPVLGGALATAAAAQGADASIPWVPARAILLAVRAHVAAREVQGLEGPGAWRGFWRARVRAAMATGFLSFLLPGIRSRGLVDALLRAYGGLVQGLPLHPIGDQLPGGCVLRLAAPAGTVDRAAAEDLAAMLEEIIAQAGARLAVVAPRPGDLRPGGNAAHTWIFEARYE